MLKAPKYPALTGRRRALWNLPGATGRFSIWQSSSQAKSVCGSAVVNSACCTPGNARSFSRLCWYQAACFCGVS